MIPSTLCLPGRCCGEAILHAYLEGSPTLCLGVRWSALPAALAVGCQYSIRLFPGQAGIYPTSCGPISARIRCPGGGPDSSPVSTPQIRMEFCRRTAGVVLPKGTRVDPMRFGSAEPERARRRQGRGKPSARFPLAWECPASVSGTAWWNGAAPPSGNKGDFPSAASAIAGSSPARPLSPSAP